MPKKEEQQKNRQQNFQKTARQKKDDFYKA
jgi:hypothetical protein